MSVHVLSPILFLIAWLCLSAHSAGTQILIGRFSEKERELLAKNVDSEVGHKNENEIYHYLNLEELTKNLQTKDIDTTVFKNGKTILVVDANDLDGVFKLAKEIGATAEVLTEDLKVENEKIFGPGSRKISVVALEKRNIGFYLNKLNTLKLYRKLDLKVIYSTPDGDMLSKSKFGLLINNGQDGWIALDIGSIDTVVKKMEKYESDGLTKMVPDHKALAYFRDIKIPEKFQGQGLSYPLMCVAFKIAKEFYGKKYILLFDAAQKKNLYEKIGFIAVFEDSFYKVGKIDDVLSSEKCTNSI